MTSESNGFKFGQTQEPEESEETAPQDDEPQDDEHNKKFYEAMGKVRKSRTDFVRMEPDLEFRIKQFMESPYVGMHWLQTYAHVCNHAPPAAGHFHDFDSNTSNVFKCFQMFAKCWVSNVLTC